MATFDQFANQGGAAAESADALAEARRRADEHLKNADYAGDLPEPLGSADEAAGDADSPATGSSDEHPSG
jgi:hypothetical protein